jgi:hypothetical protein
MNEAFIAAAMQTEYQRSFNTQTLNYSVNTSVTPAAPKFQPGCSVTSNLCRWQKTSLEFQIRSFNIKRLIHKEFNILLLSNRSIMYKKCGTAFAYKPMKTLGTVQISVFT